MKLSTRIMLWVSLEGTNSSDRSRLYSDLRIVYRPVRDDDSERKVITLKKAFSKDVMIDRERNGRHGGQRQEQARACDSRRSTMCDARRDVSRHAQIGDPQSQTSEPCKC